MNGGGGGGYPFYIYIYMYIKGKKEKYDIRIKKNDIHESFDQGVLVLDSPAGFSGFFFGPGFQVVVSFHSFNSFSFFFWNRRSNILFRTRAREG